MNEQTNNEQSTAGQNLLLEMKNISKQFPGVKALDNVSFELQKGSIHALLGENGAGKSTLMKCLFGIFKKDSGDIYLDGKHVDFTNSREALISGVSMVHQELDQVRQRSVMDNIWLGRYPNKLMFIDDRKMYKDTKKMLSDLGLDIDPRKKIGQLSVSERQMIEIAKATSYNSKVIVLDEPTSSLTEKEVDLLFKTIRTLRDNGCGIIYISHKLEEILSISDQVTVLRDGQRVVTKPVSEMTIDSIITYMVGRAIENRYPPKDNTPGDVVLSVKNLTSAGSNGVRDISFDLRAGEVLGVSGLLGSRRTELVETIFGIRKKSKGEIYENGALINSRSPRACINNGLAMLTEERRHDGIFATANIEFNSTIANIPKFANTAGVLNKRKMRDKTDWVIKTLSVKTPGQGNRISKLSGGNQQKVIFGRWLLTSPSILLLDEPTRGIDVGAKYEIYKLILDLVKQGKSVVFISSEMPELLGICDRIMVMSNGRLADILEVDEELRIDGQEKIMRLSSKYLV